MYHQLQASVGPGRDNHRKEAMKGSGATPHYMMGWRGRVDPDTPEGGKCSPGTFMAEGMRRWPSWRKKRLRWKFYYPICCVFGKRRRRKFGRNSPKNN